MSRPNEVTRDPSERLYWLQSPVCLERREDLRGGAPPSRSLVKLARKMGRVLSRILKVRAC